MKLLILGGTRFLGRHLVESALAGGHRVTLFNRGQTNPGLFPQVDELHGDRDGGLDILEGRSWDAVIDTCGYFPRLVRASAELLDEAVGHYTFISSVSVYADFSQTGITEEAPVGTIEDESVEDIGGGNYGPLKALCEQAVEAAMPGRALILRPGLIVGPHDPSDRFTYWPWRAAQGGQVLAPGDPGSQVQFIHARDLADWNLRLIEDGQAGVYNAVGPAERLRMGAFLEACLEAIDSDASLTWVEAQFLLDQGVEPWSEMPLWLPGEEYAGMDSVDIGKALAAGLTFRPLKETIGDTLDWAQTRPADHEWRSGLRPEKEMKVLRAWEERG